MPLSCSIQKIDKEHTPLSRTVETLVGDSLRFELRALRKVKGLTCVQIAEQLGWQASKVSRLETGKQRIKQFDLDSMLDFYRVSDAERRRLLELAERAQTTAWWDLCTPLTHQARTMIRLEQQAFRIDSCQPLVLPALLQTGDYFRALLRSSGVDEPTAETLVAAQMARQAILSRERPPELHAIMDETIFHRVIGNHRVMGRQLRHLMDMAHKPTITLQVLPLSLGAHPGLSGSFTLLDFREHAPIACLDHRTAAQFLERPQDVEFFRHELDKLIETALTPAQSLQFIAAAAEQHEAQC